MRMSSSTTNRELKAYFDFHLDVPVWGITFPANASDSHRLCAKFICIFGTLFSTALVMLPILFLRYLNVINWVDVMLRSDYWYS